MVMSTLQDEVISSIAKQMQQDIDDKIMSSILIEDGWTSVEFYFKSNEQAIDIILWLNRNCKNNWQRLGSNYLFKYRQDAEWFILRWV
jgi:hypothetical protein